MATAAATFNPVGKHAWLARDESLSDALLVLVKAAGDEDSNAPLH
jgi:hypothetical protein